MPRRDISMDGKEVEAFLRTRSHMIVGAVGDDGWPTGTIVASTFADGQLRIRGAVDDSVVAELDEGEDVCVIADEHEAYYQIRGVIINGVAGDRIGDDVSVAFERTISFDFGRLQEPGPT
jgi:hypothetical protein